MNDFEKLKEAQEINDLVTDLVYIKNMDGVYVHCNKAYLKYFNLKKEQIVGKNDFELFKEEDALKFRENDKELLDSKHEQIIFEEKITSNTFETNYFESIKKISRDENNKPKGIIGVSKDITLRKQYKIINKTTQDILLKITEDEELDDLYDLVIKLTQEYNKNSIASIVLLDKEGKKIEKTISKSLPKFYNEALIGLEIGDKIGSCGTAAYRKERVIVENIDEHEYWQNFLSLTQKANLHSCWSQPIISYEKDILGTFAIYYPKPKKPNLFELQLIESFGHLIGIAIDKKIKEKKIKEKELLLIQQSKMASLGEMIENIAHQWRQPLSVILSGITTIKLNKELNIYTEANIDELTNRIIKSSEYLSTTIDDFRNYFAKDKVKKKFRMTNLVLKVEDLISQNLMKNDVNLVKNIDRYEIVNLENEIIHVLINIINNAIDAHKRNIVDKKYTFIKIFRKDNKDIIEIYDNAGGIEESIIDKIFEPYFTTKHKSQGTGIGLYMATEIIVKHLHGEFSVKNHTFDYNGKTYEGAKFTIKIPENNDQIFI